MSRTTGFYQNSEVEKNLTATYSGPKVKSKPRSKGGYPTHSTYQQCTTQSCGINLNQLIVWRTEQLTNQSESEEIQQEISVTNMRNFALAIESVLRIQAWVRMRQQRRRYRQIRGERMSTRRDFFTSWHLVVKVELFWRRKLKSKHFLAWAEECSDRKRMLGLALSLFRKALARQHLSAQITSAFFHPQPWHEELLVEERVKVRQKVMQTLFVGWQREAYWLRLRRFKGSQALIRAARKGATRVMWAHETRLVTFHLWHRYIVARRCMRRDRDEPIPHFGPPSLPEWNRLLQTLSSKRVRQQRCEHLSSQLALMRCFRWWRRLQGMDIPPEIFNSEAISSKHYRYTLCSKVFFGWYGLSRERGRIFRMHQKCFRAWAGWAPRKRRLNALRGDVKRLVLQHRKAVAYKTWSNTCHEIIGLRMYTLRGLRRNICARNVLSVSYALTGRVPQLVFLQCWRRWQLWWSARRRWKVALRKSRIAWFQVKAKEILRAWLFVTKLERGIRDKGLICEIGTSIDASEGSASTKTAPPRSPLLGRCLRVLYELCGRGLAPSLGDTDVRPTEPEFLLCCRALYLFDKDADQLDSGSSTDALSQSTAQGRVTLSHTTTTAAASDVTRRLQLALETMETGGVEAAIRAGAQVRSSHVGQALSHFGDRFTSLLAVLLAFAPAYCAERVLHDDLEKQMLLTPSPLSALLLGLHLSRWQRRDVTQREVDAVARDDSLSRAMGSNFQTTILWRAVTLRLLRERAKELRRSCTGLPATASEDEVVATTLRRNRCNRLFELSRKLARMLDMAPAGDENWVPPVSTPLPWSSDDILSGEQPLIFDEYEPLQPPGSPRQRRQLPNPLADFAIGPMLREYLLLTGRLQEEAFTLRRHLLERDDCLLRKSFERQARLDYLSLKLQTLHPGVKVTEQMLREYQEKLERQSHSRKGRRRSTSSTLSRREGLASTTASGQPGSPDSYTSSFKYQGTDYGAALAQSTSRTLRIGSKSFTRKNSVSYVNAISQSLDASRHSTKTTSSRYAPSRSPGGKHARLQDMAVVLGPGSEATFASVSKSELLSSKLSHILSRDELARDPEADPLQLFLSTFSPSLVSPGLSKAHFSTVNPSSLIPLPPAFMFPPGSAGPDSDRMISGSTPFPARPFGSREGSSSWNPFGDPDFDFLDEDLGGASPVSEMLVESWESSPVIPGDEESQKRCDALAARKLAYTREVLIPRLLSTLSTVGLVPPQVLSGERVDASDDQPFYKPDSSVGYSEWLFFATLFDPSQRIESPFASSPTKLDLQFRNNEHKHESLDGLLEDDTAAPLVTIFPDNWWDPHRLLRLLQKDVSDTDMALAAVEESAHKTHLQLEKLDIQRDTLLDHIRTTREQLRRIGDRSLDRSTQSAMMGSAKERIVIEMNRMVAAKKKQIARHQLITKGCHQALREGDTEAVFDLLGIELKKKRRNPKKTVESLLATDLAQESQGLQVKGGTGEASPTASLAASLSEGSQAVTTVHSGSVATAPPADKLRSAAVDYLKAHEAKLQHLQDTLAKLEASEKHHNQEFLEFSEQTKLASNMMGELARERFSSIVDVQDMVNRYSARREQLEAQGNKEVEVLTTLMRYRQQTSTLLSLLHSQEAEGSKSSGPTLDVAADSFVPSALVRQLSSSSALISPNTPPPPLSGEDENASPFLDKSSDLRGQLKMSSSIRNLSRGLSGIPGWGESSRKLGSSRGPSGRGMVLSLTSREGDDLSVVTSQSGGDNSPSKRMGQHGLNSPTQDELEEMRIAVFEEYWEAMEAMSVKKKGKEGEGSVAYSGASSSAIQATNDQSVDSSIGATQEATKMRNDLSQPLVVRGVHVPAQHRNRIARLWKSVSDDMRHSGVAEETDDGATEQISPSDSPREGRSEDGPESVWASMVTGSPQSLEAIWKLDLATLGQLAEDEQAQSSRPSTSQSVVSGYSQGFGFASTLVVAPSVSMASKPHKGGRAGGHRSSGFTGSNTPGGMVFTAGMTSREGLSGGASGGTKASGDTPRDRDRERDRDSDEGSQSTTTSKGQGTGARSRGGNKGSGVQRRSSLVTGRRGSSLSTASTNSPTVAGMQKRKEPTTSTVPRADPFAVIGLKQAEKLKVNAEIFRGRRYALDADPTDDSHETSALSVEEEAGTGVPGPLDEETEGSAPSKAKRRRTLRVRFGTDIPHTPEEELDMEGSEGEEEADEEGLEGEGVTRPQRSTRFSFENSRAYDFDDGEDLEEEGEEGESDDEDLHISPPVVSMTASRAGLEDAAPDQGEEGGLDSVDSSQGGDTTSILHSRSHSPVDNSKLLRLGVVLPPTAKGTKLAVRLPLVIEGVNSAFRELLRKKREREQREREAEEAERMLREAEERARKEREEEEERLRKAMEEEERSTSSRRKKRFIKTSGDSPYGGAGAGSGAEYHKFHEEEEDGLGAALGRPFSPPVVANMRRNSHPKPRPEIIPYYPPVVSDPGPSAAGSGANLPIYSTVPLPLSVLAMSYHYSQGNGQGQGQTSRPHKKKRAPPPKKKILISLPSKGSAVSGSTRSLGTAGSSVGSAPGTANGKRSQAAVDTDKERERERAITEAKAAKALLQKQASEEDLADLTYDHLVELVEDMFVEANVERSAVDSATESEVDVSKMSSDLMAKCLVDLEKRLKRLKPAPLVRGKIPIRSELARLLRATQDAGREARAELARDTVPSLWQAIHQGTDGGLGSSENLRSDGYVAKSLGLNITSITPNPNSYPAASQDALGFAFSATNDDPSGQRSPGVLRFERQVQDPWSLPVGLDMPVFGSSVKPTKLDDSEPLQKPVTSAVALRNAQTRATRKRVQTEQLSRALDRMLTGSAAMNGDQQATDSDTDVVMLGYRTLLESDDVAVGPEMGLVGMSASLHVHPRVTAAEARHFSDDTDWLATGSEGVAEENDLTTATTTTTAASESSRREESPQRALFEERMTAEEEAALEAALREQFREMKRQQQQQEQQRSLRQHGLQGAKTINTALAAKPENSPALLASGNPLPPVQPPPRKQARAAAGRRKGGTELLEQSEGSAALAMKGSRDAAAGFGRSSNPSKQR